MSKLLFKVDVEFPINITDLKSLQNMIDSPMKQAVEGVLAIVHLAAVFRTQNEDDIWRANLDGTKNLIAAAKAHAPQARFVAGEKLLPLVHNELHRLANQSALMQVPVSPTEPS